MNFKKYITLFSFFVIIISCGIDNKINEEVSQNCSVNYPSKNLQLITKFLVKKDYSFKSKIIKEDFTISYNDWETFEIIEKINYKDCKYIVFDFIKKRPINGNYYPKFSVLEFCFDSEKKAKQYLNKYNHIVNNQEKNYGYFILNNDRLIYFQTDVNMYSFILNDLKDDFENIINGN